MATHSTTPALISQAELHIIRHVHRLGRATVQADRFELGRRDSRLGCVQKQLIGTGRNDIAGRPLPREIKLDLADTFYWWIKRGLRIGITNGAPNRLRKNVFSAQRFRAAAAQQLVFCLRAANPARPACWISYGNVFRIL